MPIDEIDPRVLKNTHLKQSFGPCSKTTSFLMERLIGKATGNSGKFHIASRGGPLHAHLLLLWFHLEPILCLVVAAWMKGSEMMRENQSSILIYNI